MERKILFEPGYNKRSEGKGVHGLQIRFLVIGDMGAVQFLIFTDWIPEFTEDQLFGRKLVKTITPVSDMFPMAADVGYHWKHPRYPGQWLMDGECEYIGCQCYYDGSGLRAGPVLALLVEKGHDAVFEYLEKEYEELVANTESDYHSG